MKINIVIPGVGLSGGIRVLFQYAELLEKKGHDVIFYTPVLAYDVKNSNSELVNKIHVFTNSIKRINSYIIKKNQNKTGFAVNVEAVPCIKNKYLRDADLVIASAWPTAFSVNDLHKTKGKKIYFIQDYEIWNNKRLGQLSYTLPLKHIVISTWIKNKLIEQLGHEDAPIVYDGLDIEIFNNLKTNCYKYSENRKFKILMLYHNLAKKGIVEGLEAYKRLKKQYSNVELSMFGLDRKPDLPEGVIYYSNPTREELKKLYQSADVFLYTSREEGWGLTPLEAMAAGCVVVGTDTGCMLDLGKNEENVLLVEPKDVEGLVNNVIRIMKDEELAKYLAKNANETVKQLSWDKAVLKFETILKDICNEN